MPDPFGDDLAEGFVRAAEKWDRMDGDEGDLKTGRLKFPNWGLPQHKEPRSQLDWAYGSILGDRDINEHGFDQLRSHPTNSKIYGIWITLSGPYKAGTVIWSTSGFSATAGRRSRQFDQKRLRPYEVSNEVSRFNSCSS